MTSEELKTYIHRVRELFYEMYPHVFENAGGFYDDKTDKYVVCFQHRNPYMRRAVEVFLTDKDHLMPFFVVKDRPAHIEGV